MSGKIMIATPVRGSQFHASYVVSMLGCNGLFDAWMPMYNQSDIYVARNTVLNNFVRQPQFDTLLAIDSDMGWTRDQLAALIATPEPCVSGLYPDKGSPPQWMIRNDKGLLLGDENTPKTGLYPSVWVPFGFCKIDRCVFQAIIDKGLAPSYGGGTHYQFCNGAIMNDHLVSEDYAFFDMVKRAGYQPYINCDIRVEHDGRRKQ